MANSKIPALIISNVGKLVQQTVPTISQIVEKTGIQNIGLPNVKMPDFCLPKDELQKILDLRNSLINKLNSVAKIIESLNKPLDPLIRIVDITQTTLQTVHTARIVANAGLFLLPVVPGAVPAAINTAKDLEEFLTPQINIAKNSITSIKTALDYANSIIFKLVNVLKSIDQYLIGCNVSLADSPTFNNYVSQVDQQYTSLQNQQSTTNQNIEVYDGFILEIVEEQYSPTVKRRKAVAKNKQGIILLSTPLTFSTDIQTLISEIKLVIDSNNLKAN